jgi:hypothetical protein
MFMTIALKPSRNWFGYGGTVTYTIKLQDLRGDTPFSLSESDAPKPGEKVKIQVDCSAQTYIRDRGLGQELNNKSVLELFERKNIAKVSIQRVQTVPSCFGRPTFANMDTELTVNTSEGEVIAKKLISRPSTMFYSATIATAPVSQRNPLAIRRPTKSAKPGAPSL